MRQFADLASGDCNTDIEAVQCLGNLAGASAVAPARSLSFQQFECEADAAGRPEDGGSNESGLISMKENNECVDVAIRDVSRVPGKRGVSILAVSGLQCRWPVADDPSVIGGILLCGASTEATYCAAHRKLAYADRQHSRPRGYSAPATRTSHAITAGGKAIDPASREAA
jgi:hypothetical protein